MNPLRDANMQKELRFCNINRVKFNVIEIQSKQHHDRLQRNPTYLNDFQLNIHFFSCIDAAID